MQNAGYQRNVQVGGQYNGQWQDEIDYQLGGG